MTVVAIVAVIAALAIPTYQNFLVRAQATQAKELPAILKTSVDEWASTAGTCPLNGTDGFVGSGKVSGRYIEHVSVSGAWSGNGGCIVTSFFRASDVSQGSRRK